MRNAMGSFEVIGGRWYNVPPRHHIESTCCWRHMGRIRHRVFDWGKFLTLTAEEDEHKAVVL